MLLRSHALFHISLILALVSCSGKGAKKADSIPSASDVEKLLAPDTEKPSVPGAKVSTQTTSSPAHKHFEENLNEDWQRLKPQVEPSLRMIAEEKSGMQEDLANVGYKIEVKNNLPSYHNIVKVVFNLREYQPALKTLDHDVYKRLRQPIIESYHDKTFGSIQGDEFASHVQELLSYTEGALNSDSPKDDELMQEFAKLKNQVNDTMSHGHFSYPAYLYLGYHLSTFLDWRYNAIKAKLNGENKTKPHAFATELYTREAMSSYSAQRDEGFKENIGTIDRLLDRLGELLASDARKNLSIPLISSQKFSTEEYARAYFVYDYFPLGFSANVMPVDGSFMTPDSFFMHDFGHASEAYSFYKKISKPLMHSILKRIEAIHDNPRKRKMFGMFLFDWTHERNIYDPHQWNRQYLFETKNSSDVYFKIIKKQSGVEYMQTQDLLNYWFKRKWLADDIQEQFNEQNYEKGFKIFLSDLYEFFDLVADVVNTQTCSAQGEHCN